MFPNIKWLRITPDRAGRGGTKTGIHSFQQTPINDVRSLAGGHVYRGYWRRDFDPTLYSGEIVDSTGLSCLAIHGYTYPSLTDPAAAPTIKILEQNVHAAGVSVVWDAIAGAIRQNRPGTNYQGTFLNIAGRCVFGEGLAEALLMDDRTPAIHAQQNQALGIGTPTQTMPQTTIMATPNVSPDGTAYVYNSHGTNTGPYVNHPNPDNPLGTCISGDTIDVTFINSGYPGESGALSLSATLAADAVSSNTTPFTNTGTVTVNSGSQLVTLAGATWPTNYQFCGLAINFNGYSFVIAAHGASEQTFDINGFVTILNAGNTQLLIQGVYDGPNYVGPYTITGCQLRLPIGTGAVAAQTANVGTLGYSQSTNAYLVQCRVRCTQASGYYRNLGNVSLGPRASDSSVGGTAILTITDADMKDGKRSVQSASDPFTAGDVGAPFFVDSAGSGGTVLSSVVGEFIGTGNVRLNDPNISGFDVVGGNAWWGSDPIVSDGVIALGFLSDLTSASNPFVPGDVGQTIVIENAGAGGTTAHITTIATYVGPGHVTLTAAAISATTGARLWWRGVSVDTHAGPTYAYAWYDPETGHMSNISPLMQLPRPTSIGSYTDFANITPVFQIDPGYLSYPTGASSTTVNAGTDGARFSHIMFFRTLSTPGSSTLYPIGSLQPFIGKVHPGQASTRGSWNPSPYHGWMGIPNNYVAAPPATSPMYWYDWSSDSDLLLSGGFRAPQYTNEKPMVLLRGGATQPGKPFALAYWDRRLWIVNTQEPNKIAYSCDEAQCPLGVPEESFPPTNFLRLPSAADGKVMGMRTVGDKLLITTQRFAYIVAGNNESNYRLMKISSAMPGVETHQMDEFPTYTGAEGEPITVFFLGTDRIVYQWTVGGSVTPISQPIQDKLDTYLVSPAGQYKGSVVHFISAWGRRLVVIGPNLSQQIGNDGVLTFIYDIDTATWNQSTRNIGSVAFANTTGVVPMATVYGAASIPVNEIYGIKAQPGLNVGVHAISWIRDDITTSTQQMRIDTFPLAFDGKKTRKQIVAVNIHASAGTWTGVINPNDQLGPGFTFATYPDPINSLYAPTGVQSAGDDVSAQDLVCMAGQFNTDGTPIVCYRASVSVLKSFPDVANAQLYAIDIGYIDMEDPGDGDP